MISLSVASGNIAFPSSRSFSGGNSRSRRYGQWRRLDAPQMRMGVLIGRWPWVAQRVCRCRCAGRGFGQLGFQKVDAAFGFNQMEAAFGPMVTIPELS